MQTFYMIVGSDTLYLYEKNGKEYTRQYIDGNPEFHYQINNVKRDMKKMMNALVEEYNLENRSELSFLMIGNDKPQVTEAVGKALEGHIEKKYELNTIIYDIIKRFSEDKKLLVEDFGINFDGVNYCLTDGKVCKADYSLLGYTLQTDDIVKCVD